MKRTWALVASLAIGLVGCQRLNPAFDPFNGGDDGTGGADASTTQTSTTQTSTTQSSTGDGDGDGTGDGDGDGTGDGDGDGTGDGDGDTGPVVDIPGQTCEVPITDGLWPRFGRAQDFLNQTCPPGFSGFVRVFGGSSDLWLAGFCPNGCSGPCDMQTLWKVGADGLEVGLLSLYPPVAFQPNMPWVGCYFVEAAENVGQGDDVCYYASLSVHASEGPQGPLLFNANRQSYGLTAAAVVQYGPFSPGVEDQPVPSCACEDLQIECCPGHTVVAKQFKLNDPVPPGGTGSIVLNQSPFTFYAAQAQSGVVCEPDPETSWAIWASP